MAKETPKLSKDDRFRQAQAAMPDIELIEKCEKVVFSTCKNPRNWTMCVPPQVDDSDMLLCELARRYKALLVANGSIKKTSKS